MKSITNRILIFAIMLFTGYASMAQTKTAANNSSTTKINNNENVSYRKGHSRRR